MKRRSLFSLIMIIALMSAMVFTACGKKTQTLESVINDNPDIKASIDEQMGAEGNGVTYEIKDNNLIYNYDISNTEGITEELAKSDEVKGLLDAGLQGQAATFANVASTLESTLKEAGYDVSGITVTVNYYYGDELLTSATFDASSGESAEEATEEAADDAAEEATEEESE